MQSVFTGKYDVPETRDNPNFKNCYELLWKVNTKENLWTVTITRWRTCQEDGQKRRTRWRRPKENK